MAPATVRPREQKKRAGSPRPLEEYARHEDIEQHDIAVRDQPQVWLESRSGAVCAIAPELQDGKSGEGKSDDRKSGDAV